MIAYLYILSALIKIHEAKAVTRKYNAQINKCSDRCPYSYLSLWGAVVFFIVSLYLTLFQSNVKYHKQKSLTFYWERFTRN